MSKRNQASKTFSRRNALAVALAVGLGFTGVAMGQATTGTIFGTAPAAAGQTVRISGSGINRTVTVGQNGRYSVSNLPVGTYTVTLNKDGQTVSSHSNVSIAVGAGTEVDFGAASAQQLGAVNVRANALPSIDVTSVNSTTTITADDLKKLPIGRNAESIALLSPGTVQGSSYFGNAVSFGGSSVAENAYYVNGYNTGEPYRNIGGFQLPYGSIAQQQTLTGGFSAKYGRSDGGVISQIGKRGTNEWHFGAQLTWSPRFLSASPKSEYLPQQPIPSGTFKCYEDSDGNTGSQCVDGMEPYVYAGNYKPGTLRSYNADDKGWSTIESAYVGGPLIKDKLYMFAAVEVTQSKSTSTGSTALPQVSYSSFHRTRFYGKLDWNINDNNVFEGTFLKRTSSNGAGATYYYDYSTFQSGEFKNANNQSQDNAKFLIGKYTSYITDNATLSITYGKGDFSDPIIYAYKGNDPLITNGYNQDPAYWVGRNVNTDTGIINQQPNATVYSPESSSRTRGLRADFTYQLGDHMLGVGIDNMRYIAHSQGGKYTGGPAPAEVDRTHGEHAVDGTRWIYAKTNSGFRYVQYLNIESLTSMSLDQKAYYLQDVWQVTPNLQLNIGVRNDHYTNKNDVGVAFADEKNQWEPRLGFSWDVNGDSSFKIYGNAGRYYLALPNNAAERAANRSTYVYQLFTYTGINDDGTPQGLTAISDLTSPDGEFGDDKDPKQVTASNLKPMYVDQYNIGFDKKLGDDWVYGAKASYRDLKTTIDDECSSGLIGNKLADMGLDPADFSGSISSSSPQYCRLINPGKTSNMVVRNDITGDYVTVPMSMSDWGYVKKPKRTYAALNLYFEHPFDGKWFGRVDYTYTYAHGNTSGQVRPDFGQADVSKTEDWDSWQLMEGQDGELLNSRKHIFRFRGAYQLNPEWLFSATALVQSGTPQECLGYYGEDALGDPTGYNRHGTGNYHWCAGKIVHPGSDSPFAGHTPWTHQLNLAVRYTPAFADHKLAFKVNVFNALNEQKPTQTAPSLVSSEHVVNTFFHYPISREAPRYVRLSVSYDY